MSGVSSASSSGSVGSSSSSSSVWSDLLSRARHRKRQCEVNSSLIVLGDKFSGKSALLSKFADRIVTTNQQHQHYSINLSSSSSASIPGSGASSSSTASGAGAGAASTSAASGPLGGPSGSEYVLDYSYCNVKNKFNVDKEEILARMNIWQLDDCNHCDLIPFFLHSNLHSLSPNTSPHSSASTTSASASSSASGSSASASASSPDPRPSSFSYNNYLAHDNSCYLITLDLSEPWNALSSLQKWLSALATSVSKLTAALSPAQQSKLQHKISLAVQSYYADKAAAPISDASDLKNSSEASTDETSSTSSPSLLDGTIPPLNLGVPIIVVGCKADSFAKHLGTKQAVDEKFEYLTRNIRKLCIEYGASLIYTSCLGKGVNIDELQLYVFHRLYRFPFPHANNKLMGSTSEDDWNIFIPTGFDTTNILDTVTGGSSNHIDDSTPMGDVFKNPFVKSRRSIANPNGSGSASRASITGSNENVKALDNALFFKNLKFQLEQGGFNSNSTATASNPNLNALLNQAAQKPRPPSAAAASASASTSSRPSSGSLSTSTSSPSLSSASIPSSATPSVASSSASSSSASAAAAAAAANQAKVTSKLPPKGQIAVKQFFRSLLNNNPKSDASNPKASAQQKAIRSNAEKELLRMNQGDAADANQNLDESQSPQTDANSL